MAQIGGYRVKAAGNVGSIIVKLVGLVILLFVTDQIISGIPAANMDDNSGTFYQTFDFLGINSRPAAGEAGLVSIIGIVGAAAIILSSLNITRM